MRFKISRNSVNLAFGACEVIGFAFAFFWEDERFTDIVVWTLFHDL